ncbi:MAG: dTDP-4-dehydrorhamnose 3,5-epimerase [Coriobacteriaceae bacterium]|jgi:dTDP-4-dehydrorhamnose 3,5-epimerase|nr:dTDP-4-dehydrorhamnose 3,5-epimerase [Coriobacteriaceae bacterium]
MTTGDRRQAGNFTFIDTPIEGLKIVETASFGDERGSFMETYKRPDFILGGIDADFVQDNQSVSVKGVLRGLHFQIQHPQAKLVRVLEGEVYDVAVDMRKGSTTFGKWEGVLLSAANRRQFFIPRGFAHGFLVLSEKAVFAYKCDDIYRPGDEGGLLYCDPDIAIEWPDLGMDYIISANDKENPVLEGISVPEPA